MLLALKTVLDVPSPQATVTCQGLSAPGSVKEPSVKDLLAPSLAVWAAGAVTVGATLLTVTWKEAWSLLTPSLTVTVAVKTPDVARCGIWEAGCRHCWR